MVYHDPFDLYYWFVTVFAGNLTIFYAITFVIIAMMVGMFRMPAMVVGIMFALFIIVVSPFEQSLLTFVIIILGVIAGWLISRWFK